MKRLICYAHYDANGQVRPFVLHALQVMQSFCLDLVFISNSPLTGQDREQLAKLCSTIIVNNNTGYDFYMWRLGLESVDLSLYDEVVLMNSSVFGPLFAMESVFSAMDSVECDFWGITECFQMQPHIQTYFLAFNKKVIVSETFNAFWRGVLPYTNKMQVIQSYEVGLTQWLVESGFQPGVLCSFDRIGEFCAAAGKRLRRKDNASVKFAVELLEAGSPFLKRDAVRNRKVKMDIVVPLAQKMGYPTVLMADEEHYAAVQNCPVCGVVGRLWRKGVRNFINLFDTGRYDYLRCTSRQCGTVWLGKGLSSVPSVLSPVYQESLNREMPLLLPKVVMKAVPGNLLLVGNSSTHVHSALEKLGWCITSVYSPDNVSCETLELGLFDCVFVSCGIERCRDAAAFFTACYRLLKEGGLFCAIAINANAMTGKILRVYWAKLNAPNNRQLFSRNSLKKTVCLAGFNSVEVTTVFVDTLQEVRTGLGAILNKLVQQHRRLHPLSLDTALKPIGGIANRVLGVCSGLSGDFSLISAHKCNSESVKPNARG